jgi:hypothetical protein
MNIFSSGMTGLGFGVPMGFHPFILIILIWSLFWKGLALWHSARRNEPWWFIILLVVNSAGILEIVYIFAVAQIKSDHLFKK